MIASTIRKSNVRTVQFVTRRVNPATGKMKKMKATVTIAKRINPMRGIVGFSKASSRHVDTIQGITLATQKAGKN